MEENAANKTQSAEMTNRKSYSKKAVLYGVEDVPSPISLFLFGLQQAIMTIGSTISIPFIITGLICVHNDLKPEVTSSLLSVTMFMCGIATLMQCIFGVRLGIIQGGSHTFVAPIVAMMVVPKWKCSPMTDNNGTNIDAVEEWQLRMREIQGNLAIASVTQVVLGCTGCVGILLRFVGPLTIAPTIALIGLSLTHVVIDFNKVHWGVASFSMVLTTVFTLYINKINLPLPIWSRERGCHMTKYPIFQLLPVILSIALSWIFCLVLTETGALTSNSSLPSYQARTDSDLDVLEKAPWFYWPYPFQFGVPTVSAGGYVAFLAATLSSVIESIGDYYAAARISGAPPPPAHAVNRGIAMEGLSSIVSGLVGAGHGTTSYSSNIGAIGITKVGSRSVFITAGVILVLCGVIGKFGAILTLIPEPVIGGNLSVVFGMLIAVGISSLRFVDLTSTRNLTIIGLSIILGLMVPQFINDPENAGIIQTGSDELDQMITVMLSSAMFVGGFVGLFLDNTVPGTPEERGMLSWRLADDSIPGVSSVNTLRMYDLPLVTECCKKITCCSLVPLSPSFNKEITCPTCKRRSRDNVKTQHAYDNDVTFDEIEIDLKIDPGPTSIQL